MKRYNMSLIGGHLDLTYMDFSGMRYLKRRKWDIGRYLLIFQSIDAHKKFPSCAKIGIANRNTSDLDRKIIL